jgi:hypothetical protein
MAVACDHAAQRGCDCLELVVRKIDRRHCGPIRAGAGQQEGRPDKSGSSFVPWVQWKTGSAGGRFLVLRCSAFAVSRRGCHDPIRAARAALIMRTTVRRKQSRSQIMGLIRMPFGLGRSMSSSIGPFLLRLKKPARRTRAGAGCQPEGKILTAILHCTKS